MQLKEASSRQRFRGGWRAGSRACALLLVTALVAGCGSDGPGLATLPAGAVVLAFGDSLTAGTGAEPGEDYPARLTALTGLTVINAGVPGETSGEARTRLPGLLAEHAPALVLLCSGGNDLLRRLPAADTAANLEAMIAASRAGGAQVLLIGVPAPGLRLRAAALYRELGARLRVPVEADALPAVLAERTLKADPIHPNAAGYAQLAGHLAASLRALGALPPA